jgi:hypothetical protein
MHVEAPLHLGDGRPIHVKAGSNLLLSEAAHHANMGEARRLS